MFHYVDVGYFYVYLDIKMGVTLYIGFELSCVVKD